jgi:hypothetical protein
MDVFPFSAEEWRRVEEAALSVTNASLANDGAVRASHFQSLMEVLDDLRKCHGEHPVLRETEADFLDDPVLQRHTYRLAIQLAERNGLPTLSIRISLSRVLLEDFRDPKQAADELAVCRCELSQTADSTETQEWSELMRRCGRQSWSGGTP